MQQRAARTLIERLLPRSLFARVALVMFVGFIVMQLVGLSIFGQLRERDEGHMVDRRVVERSLDVLALLQQQDLSKLDPELLAARKLAVLSSATTVPNDARLHAALLAAAPAGSRFALWVARSHIAADHQPRETRVTLQLPTRAVVTFAVPRSPGFGPPPPAPGGTADEPPGPPHWLGLPWPIVVDLLIRGAILLGLSLLVVRWFSRPLTALSDAAERIGNNLQTPPLAEIGPIEVRRAAHAFNRMQARLQRVMEEQTRILAAVSHDLKTPLTRLRLRAESVEGEVLRGKIHRDLDEMDALLNAALDFLRGESWREASVPVDINALLAALADDAVAGGGTVTLHSLARQPYPAQPLALKRCLDNLLQNGLKYGGGRVDIDVSDQPDRLVITLRDQGPGIPEALFEQVFEPFYRVEGSRSRETGGTGLGLAIARSIARAHGGDIQLANRAGGGLAATLSLPRR
ncbi:ATP-binding protein [Chitinolyticbacter meiyuanensis]|uniref:ATP-binding protein n=1 Tax=Chitinolyticbacter meiyuanensis TaxID=682798 RepID=UPI0011E60080|nr:ATP-binding protein [Chitinolyticbacter meiyuanensis]